MRRLFPSCLEISATARISKPAGAGIINQYIYILGLKNDLDVVKNGIHYKYNNGLAEGSVNKNKLIKRIKYGRNSFELLEAKVLLHEYFYQFNAERTYRALMNFTLLYRILETITTGSSMHKAKTMENQCFHSFRLFLTSCNYHMSRFYLYKG